MDRNELLVALALLFLLGMGALGARLLEARRTGLSLRLQVFIPLAATTLVLSAMFAVIVIDRFTARASLFATLAAEDEARVVAELAARVPQEALRPVLLAFTRSSSDTDVAVLDASGAARWCARSPARWSRCAASWRSGTRWRPSSPTSPTS